MAVKVAINGFGRVGRLAFREMFLSKEFDLVAINDLTKPQMLAHLLKYDSCQGRYERSVSSSENAIVVDDKEVVVYAEREPKSLPWAKLGVDVVIESTGFFASSKGAQAHLDAGAKKVVISAPAGDDVPTIVFGVNEETLKSTDKIISTASCTTNCLAPMVNVLNNLAKIQKGFMTTVHAYTNDQNLLDAPQAKGNFGRSRAAAINIVPNATGAAKAIGLVIPELAGKLDGSAQRVPVPVGSVTELVAVVQGKVTKSQINEAMRAAKSPTLGYNEDEIVSSDVIGIRYGSLFDATQTKVTELGENTLVKVAAWYDNETSYTNQMVRVVKYIAEL